MTKIIFNYILTFAVFLAIDMLWLGFIAKNLYKKYLGNILSNQINWPAAIIFYLIFVIGILIFAVYPAINKNDVIAALSLGALFGAMAYATYDLTNWATLKDWPWQIVIIDIIWGAVLAGLVSTAGFYITKYFN